MALQSPCEPCRYHRGARRAIHAPGQGVLPPPGDSRRRRQCRRRRTVCPLVFKQLVGRQSPHVAASMKHHLRLHCQLVESNLLALTSVPDPIINVCVLDHIRCDQLARNSWPRRRAMGALPAKACFRHKPWRAGRGVASAGKAWRRSCHAKRAVAAIARGVPYMHPGKACCCHRATRGAAANVEQCTVRTVAWDAQIALSNYNNC